MSKSSVNSSILSRIEVMDEKARIEEIARMLGGVKITETTRKHAAGILGLKAEPRGSRQGISADEARRHSCRGGQGDTVAALG